MRRDEAGTNFPVDVEDSVHTLLEMASGARGTITASWLRISSNAFRCGTRPVKVTCSPTPCWRANCLMSIDDSSSQSQL